MADETLLRQTIGLADACELLQAAVPYPYEALCEGLASGALVEDARACLEEIGLGPAQTEEACAGWEALRGRDPEELLAGLRRAYSLLHIRQGSGVAVWPYEAAFLHAAAGKPGEPALFRAPVTLAVEASMREAGVLPEDSRNEPCDSARDEFSFLSYLLGKEAEGLSADDGDAAALWRGRSDRFLAEHALRWLPAFFAAVARETQQAEEQEAPSCAPLFYSSLCSFGKGVMGALALRLPS